MSIRAVPATAAAQAGIQQEVVKHHEAKRGFVLLFRRWMVVQSFAWTARFRRLARDYERLAATLVNQLGLPFDSMQTNVFSRLVYP